MELSFLHHRLWTLRKNHCKTITTKRETTTPDDHPASEQVPKRQLTTVALNTSPENDPRLHDIVSRARPPHLHVPVSRVGTHRLHPVSRAAKPRQQTWRTKKDPATQTTGSTQNHHH